MRDFRELQIWSRAHAMTLDVYRLTTVFPKDELYGLTSQMRRSAASIPTNIAEGCGRESPADYGRFLQIAMGSASELEYQFVLARDLGYIPVDNFDRSLNELIEIKRMVNAYLQKIKASSSNI